MEENKEKVKDKKEEKKEMKITLGTFTVLIVALLVLVVTIIFAVYLNNRLSNEQAETQNVVPISIQIIEEDLSNGEDSNDATNSTETTYLEGSFGEGETDISYDFSKDGKIKLTMSTYEKRGTYTIENNKIIIKYNQEVRYIIGAEDVFTAPDDAYTKEVLDGCGACWVKTIDETEELKILDNNTLEGINSADKTAYKLTRLSNEL